MHSYLLVNARLDDTKCYTTLHYSATLAHFDDTKPSRRAAKPAMYRLLLEQMSYYNGC